MNYERFTGICKQAAGRINEVWGELAGDPQRAADGRRAQIAGIAQQRKGRFKEEAAHQLREFLLRNRHWHF